MNELRDVKSAFTYSHIMAWTVSPNSDQLEFFVPSTINPRWFDEDLQQFNVDLDSAFRLLRIDFSEKTFGGHWFTLWADDGHDEDLRLVTT